MLPNCHLVQFPVFMLAVLLVARFSATNITAAKLKRVVFVLFVIDRRTVQKSVAVFLTVSAEN